MLTQQMTYKKAITIATAAVMTALIALSGTAQSNVSATSKGDRMDLTTTASVSSPCAKQAWPNYDQACLGWINARAEKSAPRTITIEQRDEANNTSTLIRMPVTTVAAQ